MNFLNACRTCAARPAPLRACRRFRKPSPCDVCLPQRDKKPCFDLRAVSVERGGRGHAELVASFLRSQYWPREPSVAGLWLPLDCAYLDVLTERYSHQGDRFLAFERTPRTKERRLIGVCVANKVFPWMVAELEEWAHYTASPPERHRIYFTAHCLKRPDLFNKYRVDFIYDIEVLGTAAEVTGQGVAGLLLRAALAHAHDLRYPLAQLLSLSQYTKKCCERAGMRQEWSMEYAEFVDAAGRRVFFPRRPHGSAALYVKRFELARGGRLPCRAQYHDVRVLEPP